MSTIGIVAEGLDHPECVAVGPDGALYAGGEAGQLYAVDPADGTFREMGSSGGWLLGLAVDADGNVIACDPKRGAVVVFDVHGNVRTLSTGAPGRAMITPNYPVLLDDGTLLVSDSGTWPAGGGCIFRIAADGTTSVWSESAPHFTNGLALDASGSYLYVAESTLPGISRIPIAADGSAGPAEIVVLLPGTVPDGVAFDVEGRLYIGCYRPDRVYTLEPDGTLLVHADDHQGTLLAAPTNLAFGGEDHRELYIASLGRWHIARIRTEAAGLPLRYPRFVSPEGSEGGPE